MDHLRILIADDHPGVRVMLRNILESVPDWEVCCEAPNGASAVKMADRLNPDVIVMDLMMPECNGLEATRQVLRAHHEMQVILTTVHEFPAFVEQARRVGACGCFFKTESGTQLIPAVRVAAQHSAFFTPQDLKVAGGPRQPPNAS
jgi:DNA-binding NarL/FixJ family response regulator